VSTAGDGDRSAAQQFGHRLLVTVPEWILGALMLVGIGITFANVIGRYVFGAPIFWAEEILVFIVIWGVFIGLASITYRGDYLNMDLFSANLHGKPKLVLNVVVAAALVICCTYAAIQSWRVVMLFMASDQRTVSAGIPKALPHAALLVGFALVPIAVILRLRAYLSGKF
jgi:TRAP-type C4-dicarboxylate transport system permease small subunit